MCLFWTCSFPIKLWQQKIPAILVNDCSFHQKRISRGQLGGVAAVPEGQGRSQSASRTDTLVSQAGED